MEFVFVVQRNLNFHCGILWLVPYGQVWGLQLKQGLCWVYSLRQICSDLQYKPGRPRNLIYYPSKVTQQSHISPLHFLCRVVFFWARGRKDHWHLSRCECVHVWV